LKLRFQKLFESTKTKVILTFITPSSAAVFKLWFYGILLRSKTIKLRLKNCPRSAATGAATTCYRIYSMANWL
jgi:hypothetical protein